MNQNNLTEPRQEPEATEPIHELSADELLAVSGGPQITNDGASPPS